MPPSPSPSITVQEALTQASARIDRRDAELLLLHALRHQQRDRAWLRAHSDAVLNPADVADFFDHVSSREQHTPIQYLTGRQEFFGLDLQVTRDTLIPRPETEVLVEAVLHWIAKHISARNQPARIVDIGTGTGAIALALATHLPDTQVWALDISPATRPVVERNASHLGLSQRVRFTQSDLLSQLQPELTAGLLFDVIVSNPPYVATADAPTLQPEVRDFEPHTALFAGPDGLATYRRLIPQALSALRPGGLLAMEFGFGQRDALAALLAPWHNVQFLNDLAGIPRVVLAERP